MKRFSGVLWTCLALACLPVFIATGALADVAVAVPLVPDTVVSIPWGNMLFDSASFLIMIAGAVITWSMRFLPAQASALIKTSMLDQILMKAIAYGINTTAGAERGKELNLDVGNQVVAQGLQYVLDHAPGWAVNYAGGTAMLEQKIIARLNVAPDAALSPSQ